MVKKAPKELEFKMQGEEEIMSKPCETCGNPRPRADHNCVNWLKLVLRRVDENVKLLEDELAVLKGTQTIEQRVNFEGSVYDLPGFEPRMSDWDKSRWSEKLLRELSKIHGLIPNREKIMNAAIGLLGYTPGFFPFKETFDGEDAKDPEIGVSDDCPFFTESYLYSLLGKEDARTVLSLVGTMLEACGITHAEQDQIVNATYRKAVAERERQEAYRERWRKRAEESKKKGK